MAKKRVSSVELTWMIVEQMKDDGNFQKGLSVAVIPDSKLGWRAVVEAVAPGVFKPFAQSFYVDLSDDPDQPPQPIHLGIRGGRQALFRLLDELRSAGVHHVILNLKYGARDAAEVLDEIGQEVFPQLNASQQAAPGRMRARGVSRG